MLVEMTEGHLDAVARIEARSSDLAWSRDLLAGELTMPVAERHWLVATTGTTSGDERVMGFGGMMIVGDEAHLMNIAVEPSCRRSGIARSLLSQLILDVVDRGAKHLTLEVRADNDAALQLYRRFGLEPAGQRKNYYGVDRHAVILWAHGIDDPTHVARMQTSDEPSENGVTP